VADSCNINITCRYAEMILMPGYDTSMVWFKSSSISKQYLMQLTVNKLS